MSTTYRKKLIEVALPLDAINKESAREKSIRHGHPSTLHLWWARRPLAACRAVLFAQMVDDPSSLPDEFPTEEAQEAERQRLFRIIEEMVKWENTTNEAVLHAARTEIARSAARNHGVSLPGSMTTAEVSDALKQYAPPVLDPFAGGGSIPLEAQRLGLEAHASDLNPVAVLINKALIEIPPKFAGRPPVNPESRETLLKHEWRGAQGLAEDVRYYGRWMRDEAWKRVGHLYPKVQLPKELGGGEATVIAWLWARTVRCPNPACGAQMPLVRSFALSTKKGKEVWIEPVVDREVTPPTIRFVARQGPGAPAGTVSRTGASCIACSTSVPFDHVRAEGKAGRMDAQMMAIVAEGKGGRLYLPPSEEQQAIAAQAQPHDVPETDLPEQALGFRVQGYGMTKHCDLFTSRQLVALTTFSDLAGEARVLAETEGDTAYASAVATYLALAVDKATDRNTSLCSWEAGMDRMRNTFGRQALPMVWDYTETNPFAGAGGDIEGTVGSLCEVLDRIQWSCFAGAAKQADAAAAINGGARPIISTDPPYYDNVPYADLSDFFYVWLRRSLAGIYPQLFSTLLVPKSAELVAEPARHGGREQARQFFEEGLGRAFAHIHDVQDRDYPLAVYYAFKQAEAQDEEAGNSHSAPVSASTGWETMLEGLLRAGFAVRACFES